jgi:prepilin-type processing-associated H-X9-DG protein
LKAIYGMNGYSFTDTIKLVQLRKQAPQLIYFSDTMAAEEYGNPNWLSFLVKPKDDFVTFASWPVFRHSNRANIVFLDGHIEALTDAEVDHPATHQWAYWIP